MGRRGGVSRPSREGESDQVTSYYYQYDTCLGVWLLSFCEVWRRDLEEDRGGDKERDPRTVIYETFLT